MRGARLVSLAQRHGPSFRRRIIANAGAPEYGTARFVAPASRRARFIAPATSVAATVETLGEQGVTGAADAGRDHHVLAGTVLCAEVDAADIRRLHHPDTAEGGAARCGIERLAFDLDRIAVGKHAGGRRPCRAPSSPDSTYHSCLSRRAEVLASRNV